ISAPYCPHRLHQREPFPYFLSFPCLSFGILQDLDSKIFFEESYCFVAIDAMLLAYLCTSSRLPSYSIARPLKHYRNVHSKYSHLRIVSDSRNLNVLLYSKRAIPK